MQAFTFPRAISARLLPIVCALANLAIAHQAQAQTVVVIDNGKPGFVASGAFRNSTSGSATFVGGSHMVADGLNANNLIDNESPKFSTTGNWLKRTNATEMFGASFHSAQTTTRSKNHYPPLILDNRTYNPGGSNNIGSSQWPSATAISGYYGQDYIYVEPNMTSYDKKAKYMIMQRALGNLADQVPMKLSAHWPASPSNASNAKIRVTNYYGTVLGEYTVNQKNSSGEWADLGTVTLATGVNYFIEFDANGADGRVIADAIKLEQVDTYTPDVARWELPSNLYGTYQVYGRWPKTSLAVTFQSWTIVGGKGMDYPSGSTSQKVRQGEWRLLGEVELTGQQKNYVRLDDFSYSSEGLSADAITFLPSRTFPEASWSLDTQNRATKVYASWGADASRTTEARYIVRSYDANCNEVNTSVIVNQRDASSASGKLLGTFTNNRNCAPLKVVLMPNAGTGTLSADAVRFEMQ